MLEASRSSIGIAHFGSIFDAPVIAPQIDPTVAPMESVSHPPITVRVIALENSPLLRDRAIIPKAALLIV